jgi:type I restriction enzyme S subunit
MKHSGLPWLGDIPEHWETRSLRGLVRQRSERERSDLPLLSVARERGVFVRNVTDRSENHNVVPEDLSNYKVARSGDLVINKMKAWQGSMGIAPCDGIVSPAYFVFEFKIDDPAYGAGLLRSKTYVDQLARISDGVRIGQWDLDMVALRQLPVLVPPDDEQQAIIAFVTHLELRIKRAISAKRKMIDLLNEQKQAIVHQAVTRGLDPSAPLKPSGIPWLGDIPQHWEVQRSKYLLREVDDRSVAGAETHLAMSQKLGLVPSSKVQSTLRSGSYAGGKLCCAGDLVLNRLKAHLGVFSVAKQSGVVSPDYTVLRKQNGVHTEYFECILRSPAFRGELRIRAKGIVEGFWRLYTDDFYNIYLPIPPFSEQQQIMESIKQQTREQGTVISCLEREIDLLTEYRSRLTSAVVTGKLDVREVAKSLPSLDKDPGSPAGAPAGEVADELEPAKAP